MSKLQMSSYKATMLRNQINGNNNVCDLVTALPILYHFLQKHTQSFYQIQFAKYGKYTMKHVYGFVHRIATSPGYLVKKINNVLILRTYSS